MTAPKRITLLGSTGSIGTHCAALIQSHPKAFQVVALTAQNNVNLLIEQALKLKPELAVIGNETHYKTLKEALSNTSIKVAAGVEAINQAATHPTDMVMAGIVGAAGLAPIMQAVKCGYAIGLANKEPLVCAGDILIKAVKQYGSQLLPVDSEHNAIFQIFPFEQPDAVESITLTASGGPFHEYSLQQMQAITPEQAVKHPNWQMGAKISVDSATMINKGLEVMEAYHLFPLEAEQIKVVVHPQSVIHGLVQYKDGSVLSQMSPPDMTVPIAHVIKWPERIASPAQRLDLAKIGSLDFYEPDLTKFRGLKLAREALMTGKSAPIIFNAANEIAVERFLNHEIGFLDIVALIEECLNEIETQAVETLDAVMEIDTTTRALATQKKVN